MFFLLLCSGFCTKNFCFFSMPIQRPGRAVFLRKVQTSTSCSSNPKSACISTPAIFLREPLRTSASSTAVCLSSFALNRFYFLFLCFLFRLKLHFEYKMVSCGKILFLDEVNTAFHLMGIEASSQHL